MATFVYAPQIRVRISCDGARKAENAGVEVLDISEDLVQGTLIIRTDGVHTFNFQLQNAMRKYDGYLQPMDRITVEMKRITWVRVFSGYLNNGPVFSAWPRVIQLSASCSLKRLQFWYWDPTTSAAAKLLTQAKMGSGTPPASPVVQPGQPPVPAQPAQPGATPTAPQAGAGGGKVNVKQPDNQKFDDAVESIVVRILSEVVGWPQDKVHISDVPKDWIRFAEDIGNKIIQDADVTKELGEFALANQNGAGAAGAAGGAGIAVNGKIQAGNYAGVNLNQDQANNASIIASTGAGMGISRKGLIIGIATAMQESTLRNINHGDRDSVGLFQQRPSQGWGTVAQIMDPRYSSTKFFEKLKGINYEGMSVTAAAQAVQRSGLPNAYARWEPMATAVIDAYTRSVSNGNAGTVGPAGGAAPAAANPVTAPGAARAAGAPAGPTGRNMAKQAYSVIASKPPGHILYRYGANGPMNNPDPRVLDCSSFVDVAHFRATGRGPLGSGRSSTGPLMGWVKHIPFDLALKTKGALTIKNGHVEVSLGNGSTAAARTDSNPPAKQVSIGPPTRDGMGGGLAPSLNYADAATDPQSAQQLSQILGYPVTATDPNEFGPGSPTDGGAGGATAGTGVDPFNALVNIYTWGLNTTASGDTYMGVRAMMNDTPLLPYLSNLLSAAMRSWCSAPNGDFMAWFPDYFGIFGTAGKMNVKAIELQDFTVEWNDQKIVTHQYVVGAPYQVLSQATGNVSGQSVDSSGSSTSGQGMQTQMIWEQKTSGLATMDYPEIFNLIFGKTASDEFIKTYLSRFGGRPDMQYMPAIKQGLPEFFMALYLFMQRWAAQFKAVVPMTFMPELWPGMLLALPEYGFQAYITEVQHTFKFGQGGGFQTQAAICAPSKTDPDDPIFEMLPLGGKKFFTDPKLARETAENPKVGEGNNVGRPGAPQGPIKYRGADGTIKSR